jgi:hypothetical protein
MFFLIPFLFQVLPNSLAEEFDTARKKYVYYLSKEAERVKDSEVAFNVIYSTISRIEAIPIAKIRDELKTGQSNELRIILQDAIITFNSESERLKLKQWNNIIRNFKKTWDKIRIHFNPQIISANIAVFLQKYVNKEMERRRKQQIIFENALFDIYMGQGIILP